MRRSPLYTILLHGLLTISAYGQESFDGPLFQSAMMRNPAYAGIEGDGTVRTSYLNHLPGNNYNLHSVYLSYDSYFPLLHGGAGFFVSDDYLGGIINDLKGGFSYSYFIQTGRDLYFHAGLTASLYHRGYNFGQAVFPDQIDPVGGVIMPSSELTGSAGKTAFDLGAGLVVNYKGMFGGFSVSHLAQPDLSDAGASADQLKRKYSLELAGSVGLGGNFLMRPLVFSSFSDGKYSVSGGAVFESSYLSLSTIALWDDTKSLALQAGFAVSLSDMTLFYSYRFNLSDGNAFLPLSLMHHTGLSFRLNKIEKRNNISTIIFPNL